MKFPKSHIVWTAEKNLAVPDTLNRNTPPELITRKTTVKMPQKTIQTTVPETLRITETGTTQSIGIDNTQIIDHETIQTTDRFIIIITIDHVTNPRTEILIFQIDKEIFRSHHTGIIHNIKIHNEAIEVVHSNIKDKSTRYNQLKKLNQTLPILITQKFRITIKTY